MSLNIEEAAERETDTRQRLKPLEEDMERMMKTVEDVRKDW
jgi:hypothetical protein